MLELRGYDSYLMISQPTDSGRKIKQEHMIISKRHKWIKNTNFAVYVSSSVLGFF